MLRPPSSSPIAGAGAEPFFSDVFALCKLCAECSFWTTHPCSVVKGCWQSRKSALVEPGGSLYPLQLRCVFQTSSLFQFKAKKVTVNDCI